MTSILVVEDSPVDRCLISGLLTKEPAWTVETAEHGLAALEKIGQAVPDLVLTDLQMPQMDGLDLVAAVLTAEYPGLPIILMTAHGSESLAVEALKSVVASYVPKSQLADILQSTVREVLALTAANRGHERLIESLTSTEFCFSLENDPSLIDAVVDLMQQMLSGIGLCEPSQRLQLGVVLDQALRNAMYHGNLELSVEQMQEACEDLIRGRGGAGDRRTPPADALLPAEDRRQRADRPRRGPLHGPRRGAGFRRRRRCWPRTIARPWRYCRPRAAVDADLHLRSRPSTTAAATRSRWSGGSNRLSAISAAAFSGQQSAVGSSRG